MDLNEFFEGRSFDAQDYFGAHRGEDGCTFRVLAPRAREAHLLLGERELPMGAIGRGVFELTCACEEGAAYEYRIVAADGSAQDHLDPYGVSMELRPAHRSIVRDLGHFAFHDEAWQAQRSDMRDRPLNIYELQVGSWRTRADGSPYTYDELAEPLIPYLHEQGYNFVELMPLTEYPVDASWGYQALGYFAPTARYGTPEQLMALVDALHAASIGVILDVVPAHFALDDFGLATFDGAPLYEYDDPKWGVSEWGSRNFALSRPEVRSFLQSALNFWLGTYHMDGLRLDAVSRIIYWQGEERNGENEGALEFLRQLNAGLKERHPASLIIAEDSTAWPGVTAPPEEGGLGFDYKWDLGWMHDTLDFLKLWPPLRPLRYGSIPFSMHYFANERYLLPLSHDEVVHGKRTIIDQMCGPRERKFAEARALYLYMACHPGKKLLFMGNEFGQFREWDERRPQDWELLGREEHRTFAAYMAELNHTYLDHPALWERDYEPDGFEWLDRHQRLRSSYAFSRQAAGERLVFVANLGGRPLRDYALPIEGARALRWVLCSDWQRFGGSVPDADGEAVAVVDGHATLSLAPNSAALLAVEA